VVAESVAVLGIWPSPWSFQFGLSWSIATAMPRPK